MEKKKGSDRISLDRSMKVHSDVFAHISPTHFLADSYSFLLGGGHQEPPPKLWKTISISKQRNNRIGKFLLLGHHGWGVCCVQPTIFFVGTKGLWSSKRNHNCVTTYCWWKKFLAPINNPIISYLAVTPTPMACSASVPAPLGSGILWPRWGATNAPQWRRHMEIHQRGWHPC